jgi:hypothetical protein
MQKSKIQPNSCRWTILLAMPWQHRPGFRGRSWRAARRRLGQGNKHGVLEFFP